MIRTLADAQRAFPTATQALCRGHKRGGSCRQPVVWAVTEASRYQVRRPVDPVPVADGILIVTVTSDGKAVRSRVETLFDQPADEGGPQRHMPHHATCVDVDLWRSLQTDEAAAKRGRTVEL